ncbi:MAG: DEAD/DEAH box helicase [Deltaproteobacteria bacterium]|nr:MAG: DEAD/DEAH box helicase [Deltaproteobacteria bacterium]
MTFVLRDYQEEAVNAVVTHFQGSPEPVVVVLPTGAGKSLVIAELGKRAKGRVLVLTHVKELVAQNHAKYEAWGLQGDIYAAGLKRRESQGKVVFGSIQSVARHLEEFDESYSLLVVDECHRISFETDTQYQQAFRYFLTTNPNLKILGLTATPYRMGTGWIYKYHYQRGVRTEGAPFFHSCVYELPLHILIDRGYLTPAHVVDVLVAQYDFEKMQPRADSLYQDEDLNRLLNKEKRATPKIIQQVVQLAEDRRGVMIFAATVAHAREILTYLPEGEAALILGETPTPERDDLIEQFKAQSLKYLVNVSVLTTGFDAPHVDLIAILRPTESVGLYQQIVGRGLRQYPGKEDCLVLDYAGNNYDLHSPEIGEPRRDPNTVAVPVPCPECGFENTFWGKVDGDGAIVEHYGRRCKGFNEVGGKKIQCEYRYRFKECESCGAENDIAARQCHACQGVLVDPDKKLRDALNLRDALVIRCAWMNLATHETAKGALSLKITYYGEEGTELSEYFRFDTHAQRGSFYHRFVRMHHKAPGQPFWVQSIQQVIARKDVFRKPDFVIARKDGKFWRIQNKLFDYQGAYRKADDAGPQ